MSNAELLSKCKDRNTELLHFLNKWKVSSAMDDVQEFIHNLQMVQVTCNALLNQYKPELELAETNAFVSIWGHLESFDTKLKLLEKQGKLIRFLTNNRLRKQMDNICCTLCLEIATLEEEVKAKKGATRYQPIKTGPTLPQSQYGQVTPRSSVADIAAAEALDVVWNSMFGPEAVKLLNESWFHGFMTLEESKKYLEFTEAGTFLARFSSSKPGSFALDYVKLGDPATSGPRYGSITTIDFSSVNPKPAKAEKTVNSVLVESLGAGFRVSVNNQQKVFKNIYEVIRSYSDIFQIPFSSTLSKQKWFHGDISSEEAEELIKGQKPGTFLVRFSSHPGCFAATCITETGTVMKYLIKPVPGGFMVDQSDPVAVYPTLPDLIDAYAVAKIFVTPFTHEAVSIVRKNSRVGLLNDAGGGAPLAPKATSAPIPARAPIARKPSQGPQMLAVSPKKSSAPPPVPHRPTQRPAVSGVRSWSVEDVLRWLDSINLSECKKSFSEHRINGAALLELTEEDMKNELGIILGHRKQILTALRELPK